MMFYKKKSKGQSMVEYGIILALVSLAVVGVVTNYGDNIKSIFNKTNTVLADAASGGTTPTSELVGTPSNGSGNTQKPAQATLPVYTPTDQQNPVFNGTQSYAYIPFNNAYNTQILTLEAWIKTPDTMGMRWRNVINKSNYPEETGKLENRDFTFYLGSTDTNYTNVTTLHFSSGQNSSYNNWSEMVLPQSYAPNSWHHIAITVDSTGLQKCYSDGVCIGQVQRSPLINSNSYPVKIGLCDNAYKGDVRDVRIWNTVRTDTELLNNKDYQLSGNESGLVGYWPMNETGGNIIYDKSTLQNNGVLYNVSR